MKSLKYSFIIFIFSSLISSCLEEMELDESLLQPQIAVSTFLTPGDPIYIKLMHDIPASQEYATGKEVPDAKVTLFEDDQIVTELERFSYFDYYYGYYTEEPIIPDTAYYYMANDRYPQPGKTYRLEVESETYGNITTETTIPKPIEIDELQSSIEEIRNDENSYVYKQININVRFTDPADEENYYRLLILEATGAISNWNQDSTDSTIHINGAINNTMFSTEDEIFFYEKENANSFAVGQTDNSFGIFTDETINGKEREISIYFSMNTTELDTTIGEFLVYRIELQSITKDMYYYLKSIDQQAIMYQFPFAEPIPVYSNVENGIGVFGSYSTSVYPVFYGQYPKDGVVYDSDYDFYH